MTYHLVSLNYIIKITICIQMQHPASSSAPPARSCEKTTRAICHANFLARSALYCASSRCCELEHVKQCRDLPRGGLASLPPRTTCHACHCLWHCCASPRERPPMPTTQSTPALTLTARSLRCAVERTNAQMHVPVVWWNCLLRTRD